MKVVVVFNDLHPGVRQALEDDGITAQYCDTSADNQAYWQVLCRLWEEAETFVLLEQDNIPAPGVVRALYECPSPWCAAPYLASNGLPFPMPALGCTKFGNELMKRSPELMAEKVGRTEHGIIPPRHWSHLDSAIHQWVSRLCDVCWHPAGMVRHEHHLEV